MKKRNVLKFMLKVLKFFSTSEISKEFSKLALEDKKGIIIDQLTFGMSPLDTLKLIEMVNKDVKIKMEIKRKESNEILEAISNYYPEETNE